MAFHFRYKGAFQEHSPDPLEITNWSSFQYSVCILLMWIVHGIIAYTDAVINNWLIIIRVLGRIRVEILKKKRIFSGQWMNAESSNVQYALYPLTKRAPHETSLTWQNNCTVKPTSSTEKMKTHRNIYEQLLYAHCWFFLSGIHSLYYLYITPEACTHSMVSKSKTLCVRLCIRLWQAEIILKKDYTSIFTVWLYEVMLKLLLLLF